MSGINLQAKPWQRGDLWMELHGIGTVADDIAVRGFGTMFLEKLEEVPHIGSESGLFARN